MDFFVSQRESGIEILFLLINLFSKPRMLKVKGIFEGAL